MLKDTLSTEERQASLEKSWEIGELFVRFLWPFLEKLDQNLDARLLKTMVDLALALVTQRDRHQGLVVSELGGAVSGELHAPAGVKRLSSLLHSKRWKAEQIEEELWQQADQRVDQLTNSPDEGLVIWDESENEKPESLQSEGLCAVRSSKAARLKRIKPGYYNPPGGRPIFVPGFHWLQVIVLGMQGPARLAHLRWWTSRGEQASTKRDQEWQVLGRVFKAWGQRVIHVFDQGFAGAPWLGWLLLFGLRFVLRWKKDYALLGPDGQPQPARRLVAWKRPSDHRLLWDARRRCWRKVGLLFLSVRHPNFPNFPLSLIVSRPGPGRTPWFLLTSEPVYTLEDAWHILFCYARRWQIEMTLRFEKAELAFESPRLHDLEARRKLLLLTALVHAFLLLLLAPRFERLKLWLLHTWCHRNGKWSRETPTPLFRLRLALSRLWLAFPPFHLPLLNSG